MNSKKFLIVACIIVVAVAVVLGLVLRGNETVDNSPSPSPAVSTSPSPTPKPMSYTVRFTSTGVTPSTLTVRVGDSVTFVNDSPSRPFWPASDPHPVHTLCPEFDSRRALAQGDSYSVEFSQSRTCTYHDHLDPYNEASQGTIIVQ